MQHEKPARHPTSDRLFIFPHAEMFAHPPAIIHKSAMSSLFLLRTFLKALAILFIDIMMQFHAEVFFGRMLLYLSIFRREFLVQTTALYYTGWHPMASDAKRFHAVPNGRKDSRSSMLHPAAPPPTFGPLAKWPAPWFNAGTQRTTQTDQQEKRCIA